VYTGLGYSGTPNELSVASSNYQTCLWSIANGIDAMYPQVRKRVGDWEAAARAAGVFEGNIIAFLGPFNVWEETVTSLSGQVIPLELKRVQQGGAVPNPEKWQAGCDPSGLTAFQPPPAPVPPPIADMLSRQGGAQTGAAQYTAKLSVTEERPIIVIPEAVQAQAQNLPTLVSNVQAQYRPEQQQQVLPTVFAKSTPTNGSGYDADKPSLSVGNGVTSGGNMGMLLLAGGAAFLLLAGKKKRRR